MVDSPPRHGLWRHHQRGRGLGHSHASNHRNPTQQIRPQNGTTIHRRRHGDPHRSSNPPHAQPTPSIPLQRRHQNRLVLRLETAIPRLLFREPSPRPRLLLPLALPALLRVLHRSQRAPRRHAALRHERRASHRPMDLWHPLRQSRLEPSRPPVHPRHRPRLLHLVGPRARPRAAARLLTAVRLLRVRLLVDAGAHGHGRERGADGGAGHVWHLDFLSGQRERARGADQRESLVRRHPAG